MAIETLSSGPPHRKTEIPREILKRRAMERQFEILIGASVIRVVAVA
jgi:hypothetical protein